MNHDDRAREDELYLERCRREAQDREEEKAPHSIHVTGARHADRWASERYPLTRIARKDERA